MAETAERVRRIVAEEAASRFETAAPVAPAPAPQRPAPTTLRFGVFRVAVVVAAAGVGWLAGVNMPDVETLRLRVVGRAPVAPAALPKSVPAPAGAIEPLDPFIVNLSDEDGRRYLKTAFEVEFYDPQPPAGYRTRLPQVRDLLLTLFASKTFADVRTPQGKAVLRDEVVNRLNRVLGADVVRAVYFTEFIVQ